MQSFSDSLLSSLSTLVWVITVASVVLTLIAQVGGRFVRREIDRRQNLRFVGAEKEIVTIQSQAARDKQEADTRIASLNVQAESLRLDTEKAKKEIAVAQAQAAQANEKAEAEQLQRVKLEGTLAPRRIVITDKTLREMTPFAKTQAVMIFEDGDPEARRLAEEIRGALGSYRWKVQSISSARVGMAGVHIFVKCLPNTMPPQPDQQLGEAVTILKCQLKDNGLYVNTIVGLLPTAKPMGINFPSDIALVAIGPKPAPYFAAKDKEKWYERLDNGIADMLRRTGSESEEYIAQHDKEERARIAEKYKERINRESAW